MPHKVFNAISNEDKNPIHPWKQFELCTRGHNSPNQKVNSPPPPRLATVANNMLYECHILTSGQEFPFSTHAAKEEEEEAEETKKIYFPKWLITLPYTSQ